MKRMNLLEMNIQVGKKYRLFYGKGHPMNKLMHIRAIVDKEYIVFRWYGKHKQWWHYQIECRFFFELNMKNNTLKEVK